MALSVYTNLNALTAQRSAVAGDRMLGSAVQRLSSGLRINSAKDDAAGLAIASRMTSQIRGAAQAARNANDGISMAQTAEGALSSSASILQRVRELAVQSANATNSAADRQALNQESSQLISELARIAQNTDFNGHKLLEGAFGALLFQVGPNAGQTIGVEFPSAKSRDLGRHTVNLESRVSNLSPTDLSGIFQLGNQTMTLTNASGTFTVQGGAGLGISAQTAAVDLAAKFNSQSNESGVTAFAQTKGALKGLTAGADLSFTLYGSNRQDGVSIIASVSDPNDLSGLADAINRRSSVTGIIASSQGAALTIEQSAGYSIGIENFLTIPAGGSITVEAFSEFLGPDSTVTSGFSLVSGGNDSRAIRGEIQWASDQHFTIQSTSVGIFGAPQVSSQLDAVSSIDISSAWGAVNAIGIADRAINQISSFRAKLGALGSRFETAVANLYASSENLSAARSRVEDADYAQETASLSKAQIL